MADTLQSTPTQSSATPSLTQDEAHSIGVDAYLFFYPLILMDLTRKQLTNIDQKETGKGPSWRR